MFDKRDEIINHLSSWPNLVEHLHAVSQMDSNPPMPVQRCKTEKHLIGTEQKYKNSFDSHVDVKVIVMIYREKHPFCVCVILTMVTGVERELEHLKEQYHG
jgi:hypothetical protein